MSNFKKAFEKLIYHEGSYIDDKNDIGGETYMGISRKFHPDWEGWIIIDNYKNKAQKQKDLNNILMQDERLIKFVKKFYKKNYWDRFKGDYLPYAIAEELLEQAVVLGTWKTAGINLQKALNLLNKNGELFEDLKVDGIVGPKTLEAMRIVSQKIINGERKILKLLNYFELERFIKRVKKRKVNEVYLAGGWLERI